jgi:hypothetical protein
MISEEKKFSIRKRLRMGQPQGDLVEELLQEGHSMEEISTVFNPPAKRSGTHQPEYPIAYVLGAGLCITGLSILAVFSGAQLGYLFLLGGAVAFVVGYFFEQEKKKYKP